MTGHSLRARFTLALVLGGLLMSVMASPASAAHRTRWVDDDNKNGDGPRACNNAGFSTIQAAIDASHAWDRVFVCPGNYDEQLTVDVEGLEVRSVIAQAAKLWAPETLVEVDGEAALVIIDAPMVTFRSFNIRILAGGPIFAKPEDCQHLDGVIWVRAPRAQVLGNHMKTLGEFSFVGECGYDVGIRVDDGTGNEFGPSLIWRNWIRDFKYIGISVTPESSAKVFYNAIRYVHLYDPLTCHIVPVLGFNPPPSAIFPECYGIPVRPLNEWEARVPADFEEVVGLPVGILTIYGKVHLRGNTVYSTLNTQFLPGVPEFPLVLIAGIVMIAPWDNSKVNVNHVDNTGVGILLLDEEILLPPVPVAPNARLPEAPDGVAFNGNRLSENIVGLLVAGSDGLYFGNRSHLNLWGSLIVAGEDNVFTRNDFRFNEIADCDDETVGGGTLGTANNWEDVNLGFENNPDGLCFDYWIGDTL